MLAVTQRLAGLSRRQRLVLVSMLLSIAVVITGAAALVIASPSLSGKPSQTGQSHPAAPSHPLTLSALPDPAAITATPGKWAAPSPSFAQAVAFAPSASANLFSCGSDKGTLSLALSHDGGQSWKAYHTSVKGQSCALSVSPTDAKAVALAVQQCQGTCTSTAPAALYRSADGGQSWTQAQAPAGDGFGLTLGWAGADLYAATNDPAHPLAVSLGGADFIPCDDIGRFPGQIDYLGGAGAMMFAELRSSSPATPITASDFVIVQSTNQGVVWTQAGLSDPPFAPAFARCSADGRTIIALEGRDTLVTSDDGGDSWQPAAPFPAGMTLAGANFAARAPDGTLAALLQSVDDTTVGGLYTLAPGTDTWQATPAVPKGAQSFALNWDASGHPVALWLTAAGHLLSDHF
jgi:photosystem II stability/assembly factor-like uncharacterized protein